jgi:hypothetical protein
MKLAVPFIGVFLALATAHTGNGDNGQTCPSPKGDGKRGHCLKQDDVDFILSRWPRLFDGTQADLDNIDCTVTEDFISFSEAFNFLNPAGPANGSEINVQGRENLLNVLEFELQNPGNMDRGRYSSVFEFHNCHQIAWRWEFTGNTTGHTCKYVVVF